MEIQYTPAHIADLERDISELKEKKSDHVALKMKYEGSLIELSGRKDKQVLETIKEIKVRLRTLESEIIAVNVLIKRKATLKTDIQQQIKDKKLILKSTSSEIRQHTDRIDSDSLLRLKLLELKDKYLDFSSDHTRVSSMRQMSAEFVKEIDSILKNKRQTP